ncbi:MULTISPECIES: 1,4-dihydroxy-2-naphthoate octaprenyltransferase [Proteiniphilum]|uniref:1,4-dihydroxy-2-naphthoate octaprenyltransferase n=1 Tax=Proteiniphilum TaxID=294702 RepID=UPI001EEA5323|nr:MULTISPECIES: 1,4-dihydroxy-2-naphthoate octaprenyltransferase [Proteiniphilum]ULB34098.1 1,4-dihydroxy-2-naphthoate octaprenyltransferase [Proteiniphilum propionicum]
MATAKVWISAFRLRTLFLAMATVILGSGLAWHEGNFSLRTFIIASILAVTIQILANLANDLGDFQKGADVTGKRQGPTRAIQSGKISPLEMKRAIFIFSVISVVTGLSLVISVLDYIDRQAALILIGLGGASILAALFYTMGKFAYGYRGWGDLFAFIFFGPVPVAGTFFLHTHSFSILPLLPATGMGLISTMILNINNMRDIENDKFSGKITLAVKLGLNGAKAYHSGLTLFTLFCFLGYNLMYEILPWYRYLYLFVFILLFKILKDILRKNGQTLDPYLKYTSLSGFLLAIMFSLCINI